MVEKTSVFPKDCSEALALIYVRAQDLSGREPEDIAVLYIEAQNKISAKLGELNKPQQVPLKDLQVPPTIAL